jgi:hypothetical protein
VPTRVFAIASFNTTPPSAQHRPVGAEVVWPPGTDGRSHWDATPARADAAIASQLAEAIDRALPIHTVVVGSNSSGTGARLTFDHRHGVSEIVIDLSPPAPMRGIISAVPP